MSPAQTQQQPTTDVDKRVPHASRLSTFYQRQIQQPEPPPYSINQPTSGVIRSYSPYQAYQNHVASVKEQFNRKAEQETCDGSPLPPRLHHDGSSLANHPHRRVASESRWRSPSSSPLPLRSQFHTEEHYNSGNTSPIILQRFYHQQKQQQMAKEAEESGKKRFASYIKMQLSGDRSGRSSRHQSPEPPPRLNRHASGEQSPLALRRHFLESQSNSPSLSRRYVSPSPPVPPPRRLSESTSVPGSPQHLRARFHYTPEPQRRFYQNNDIS